MANDLTVEWVTKANWATTLSLVLKDTFLYLWEGGVALSIGNGASTSWAGQQEL